MMKTQNKNSTGNQSNQSEEPNVTKEDQTYINEFSRLHTKNKIIDMEIKKINEVLQSLEDASNAIDESFGAELKLNIGESFIMVSEDEAKDYVEKQTAKNNALKDDQIGKYEQNKKRLDELKIILYTKFGKSIHLEEE